MRIVLIILGASILPLAATPITLTAPERNLSSATPVQSAPITLAVGDVLLESSTDMVTWTPSQPGQFNAANTKRFFRIRLAKRD